MAAYYNENEPFAAQWLRNLMAQGLIAPGYVDERDIRDVRPDELRGYTQCHFFAGIGGWSLALRMAGWPDDRPVWTGSCPCQPFSAAGKGSGFADERHLWPSWHHLIRFVRPGVVFGEQVPRAVRLGWLDLVQDDLEALDYAFAAAVACAVGAGAPHIRPRIMFVAHADRGHEHGVAEHAEMAALSESPADASGPGLPFSERQELHGKGRRWEGRAAAERHWWSVEPVMGRVAHGVPGRVGQLRAYGNAIVPQVAEAWIRAYLSLEAEPVRLGVLA
jgi:DNA (cytosine-5)-methyltransferase 1